MSDSQAPQADIPIAPIGTAHVSRACDLIIAATGLFLLSPLFLLIGIAIVLDSGFPIFYAQTRVGLNGRPFRIYKFRKFSNSPSREDHPLTAKDDPRMSRLGWYLAKSKLDELPQLWNVFKGDMALVGPRPESMAFAECFSGAYLRILDYKPGIFGPSQVAFRDESSLFPPGADPVQFYQNTLFPMKARSDLQYYPNRTLTSDFKWLVLSIMAVAGWQPQSAQDAGLISRAELHSQNVVNGASFESSIPLLRKVSSQAGTPPK